MVKGYILAIVFAITIQIVFMAPNPLDELTLNFNLNESPKGHYRRQPYKYGLEDEEASCTNQNPCDENDGICKNNGQCKGDLRCGEHNCPSSDSRHCCYKPGRCDGDDGGCCTKANPCLENDGDCDTDDECMGDLKCGSENCPWDGGNAFGTGDDCCYKEPGRCNGNDSGCCTKNQPCEEKDGDCDVDEDCKGDLKCGANNCPWGGGNFMGSPDDCCYNPLGPTTHGGWSAWSEFSGCSATCGPATKKMERTCTEPAPANGGAQCPGTTMETVNCFLWDCATDGGWSAWSEFSRCSATCGPSSKKRERTCTEPAPANGGAQCPGENQESELCCVDCTPDDCDDGPTKDPVDPPEDPVDPPEGSGETTQDPTDDPV